MQFMPVPIIQFIPGYILPQPHHSPDSAQSPDGPILLLSPSILSSSLALPLIVSVTDSVEYVKPFPPSGSVLPVCPGRPHTSLLARWTVLGSGLPSLDTRADPPAAVPSAVPESSPFEGKKEKYFDPIFCLSILIFYCHYLIRSTFLKWIHLTAFAFQSLLYSSRFHCTRIIWTVCNPTTLAFQIHISSLLSCFKSF